MTEDTRCKDCGGIHYGSNACPYYRAEPCTTCGEQIEYRGERKFDSLGRTYHPACTFLPEPAMKLFISDKSGKLYWPTTVSREWSSGERHNIERRLAQIKAGCKGFEFIDRDTAFIAEEDYGQPKMDARDQEISDATFAAAEEFLRDMGE